MAETKKPTEASARKATAKPASKAVAKPAAKRATTKPASKTTAKPAATTTAAKSPARKPKVTEPRVPTLRIHHLKPAPGSHTPKTRVGRGEGGTRGKTAGRGTKGTKARNQVPTRFEGGQTPIHMRIPKMRGFTNPFKVTYQVVNLTRLGRLYPNGGEITKEDLVAKGAVRKNKPVKVLGEGEIAVKVTIVDADKVSRSARAKIEAAGGSVNLD